MVCVSLQNGIRNSIKFNQNKNNIKNTMVFILRIICFAVLGEYDSLKIKQKKDKEYGY